MTAEIVDADVVIVGGGLVGSLLAHALLEIPVRVALIEARDVGRLEQPGFDGRATAIASGSKRILEQLGLWNELQIAAQPIEHIHIGQQGRFGAARIHADEEGVQALGYTVENRALGSAFWDRLGGRSGLKCLAPATLGRFIANAKGVEVTVDAEGTPYIVRAKLLVAADGTRSTVRNLLGISATEADYGQRAIIANCTTESSHDAWAYERFTPEGPLAVLPLTQDRNAIVWTLPSEDANERLAYSDAEFTAALQQSFGYRLGMITRVGKRASYPLLRLRSDELTGPRSVLIGNAAVSLHPVAGQSFNLAVRDIATLAEVISDTLLSAGTQGNAADADIGSEALLARYRNWRESDQRKVAWFTHGLVTGMGLGAPGFGALRDLGLVGFDLLPGGKRLVARHTMGMAGRVPRLARGLDLT